MSEERAPQEFWDRADDIIALANRQVSDSTPEKVSSSLLYAAARFNSFIVANSTSSAQELQRDKESAIKYFTEQYQKMLRENIDDYINNFGQYRDTGENS